MKVGLLSDIHANLPALTSVIEDMPADLDAICCVGDIVGYSVWPAACVRKVRATCDVVVQGNHDRDVGDNDDYSDNEMVQAGLRHAKDELSTDQIEWLAALPPVTEAFDGRLLVAHSHPENTDRYVTKGMFTSVATHMTDTNRVLALGHTHQQAAVNRRGSIGRDGWLIQAVLDNREMGIPKPHMRLLIWRRPSRTPLSQVSHREGQSAHIDAGLPQESADRLEEGY